MSHSSISDLVFLLNEPANDQYKKNINNLSIIETLTKPYYNGFYDDYIVIEHENKKTQISFLDPYLSEMAINESGEIIDHNYKNAYMSENNITIIKSLIQDFLLSENIVDYFERINNRSLSDPDLFNKLINIENFISNKGESLLLTPYISYSKNSSMRNNDWNNLFNERKNKNNLLSLSKILQPYSNIEKEYHYEVKKITTRIEHILPYIKNKPNLSEVSFEFFEFDKDGIIAEEKSFFKKDILKNLNINKQASNPNYNDLFSQFSEQKNEFSATKNIENYGLKYINSKTFNQSQCKRFCLSMKNNNEVVGAIVFQLYDNENPHYGVFASNSTSVKYNHRQLGVAKSLYSKLAEVLSDFQAIFVNTYYSNEGFSYLSNFKNKLNEEYQCFFFDTDSSRSKKSSVEKDYELRFLKIINDFNYEGLVVGNSEKFKKAFLEGKSIIKENVQNNMFIDYDDSIKIMETIKNKINLDIFPTIEHNDKQSKKIGYKRHI